MAILVDFPDTNHQALSGALSPILVLFLYSCNYAVIPHDYGLYYFSKGIDLTDFINGKINTNNVV